MSWRLGATWGSLDLSHNDLTREIPADAGDPSNQQHQR